MTPRDPSKQPPGRDYADPDLAVVFDFVSAYMDDVMSGRDPGLGSYLRQFPGHESIVAEEYLRQERLRSSAPGLAESEQEIRTSEAADPTADEQRLGSYSLIRELGSGGQGSVWLAADNRIQRRVALKLLNGLFITEERRQRLRREAESVARLAHPGICSVLEADVEGDQPYIAMQFIPGKDLARSLVEAKRAREHSESLTGIPWVPANRQEQNRCLLFFERAARALHAAHEANLVHRDIKPGNLIVTPDGAPVLLDFGLAQDLQSTEDLTASGDLLGTPHYMAPEQLLGDDELIDRRVDVYALGVSMFECLSGERPFEGESRYVLQTSILNDVLPDVCELNPSLGEDMRAVLGTALERDPHRRYQTALDLAEDLRRMREFEPVHARPAGVWLRLMRWGRRQPAVAAAISVTLISLTVGLVVALQLLADKERALDRAHGRQFTTRASELTDESPDLAMLLGLEAARRLDDHLGRSVLFGPLENCQLKGVLDRKRGLRFWDAASIEEGPQAGTVLGAMTVLAQAGQAPTGILQSWNLSSREGKTLLEWPGVAVRSLAVHPSGRVVVAGGEDGRLVGLDLASGVQLFEYSPGAGASGLLSTILDLEFAPGGMEFAVQLASGETLRYGFPKANLLMRIEGPALGASHLAYSPDGRHLLISGAASEAPPRCRSPLVRVFDVVLNRERFSILHGEGQDASVNWAGWAPDGRRLASAGEDGRVRLWSLSDEGMPDGEPLDHPGPVYCAAFSPTGDSLATGTNLDQASGVHLWDLNTGNVRFLQGHMGRVSDLAWSQDRGVLASASQDRTVRLWDARTGRALKVCRSQMLPLHLRWAEGGRTLISATQGYRAHLWNVGKMPHVYSFSSGHEPIRWASFLPDDDFALTTDDGGTLRLWATPAGEAADSWHRSGRQLKQVRLHEKGVQWTRLGSQGRWLLSAGFDGALELFDVQAWQSAGRVQLDPARLVDMVVCPEPLRVAVLDKDGCLTWRIDFLKGVQEVWACPGDGARWTHMALEPGGTLLAVVSSVGELWMLDLATGESNGPLGWSPGADDEYALRVADLQWRGDGGELGLLDGSQHLWTFSPAGDSLLEGIEFAHHRFLWLGASRVVLGWDERFGQRTRFHNLDSGTEFTGSLAMGMMALARPSADGRWLAAIRQGGRVEVLNSEDGEVFSSFDRHQAPGIELALSSGPGPCRVLSVDETGRVFVWPVDPVPAAQQRRPRDWGVLEKRNEWALAEGL